MRHLPKDSATVHQINPHLDWGHQEELLVLIAKLQDNMNRLYYSAHKRKADRMPDPIKIKRPWEDAKSSKATPEEIKAFLGAENIEVADS